MSSRFEFKTDPELEALKQSPAPQEVLQMLEETVKEETREVKEKVEAVVSDITDEIEIVRDDVGQVSEQVERVAANVNQLKGSLKEHPDEEKLSSPK